MWVIASPVKGGGNMLMASTNIPPSPGGRGLGGGGAELLRKMKNEKFKILEERGVNFSFFIFHCLTKISPNFDQIRRGKGDNLD